jgi:hypothetical protein
MSSIRNMLVLLLAAVAVLALAPPAVASPGQVIKDCADDGDLDRKYSNSDLKKARKKLPSDLDEYSDCREVIGAAIDRSADRGGGANGPGGGGGGAASGPTPDDQAALEDARSGKKPPAVEVGGEQIEPGKSGLFDLASARQEIPLPLLLALIAVGLLALGGGAYALRGRIPALAGLSSRLPSLSSVPFLRRRG